MRKDNEIEEEAVATKIIDTVGELAKDPLVKKAMQEGMDKVKNVLVDLTEKVQDIVGLATSGIDGTKDMVTKAVGEAGKQVEEKAREIFAKTLLSEKQQQALMGIVGMVCKMAHDVAFDGIAKGAKSATKIVGDMLGAIKDVFGNIGGLVKGEKTREQATQGITTAFKQLGQKISQEVGTIKQSFVDKFAPGRGEKTQVSHTENVVANKNKLGEGRGAHK